MSEFVAFLLEQMQPWGRVSARRMFGGHGLYRDGVFFALVADDTLYLKADETARPRFEQAGSTPFVYGGKGKPITMSYWQAPDECLESTAEMARWCQLAYAAALRARATPPPARRAAVKARRPR